MGNHLKITFTKEQIDWLISEFSMDHRYGDFRGGNGIKRRKHIKFFIKQLRNARKKEQYIKLAEEEYQIFINEFSDLREFLIEGDIVGLEQDEIDIIQSLIDKLF